MMRQCRKPTGWLGRWMVRIMNRSHAGLISWGLGHIQVNRGDAVLDVGCGGGLNVQRLARMADLGKVYGVDYSTASVSASQALNKAGVESGQVKIQNANVSCLPFPDDLFDLVTAVETHYYWPDLPGNLREIWRVLKPGGTLLITAEAYERRGNGEPSRLAIKTIGGALFSPDRHRDLFLGAGYSDVRIFLEPASGWICARGRKPGTLSTTNVAKTVPIS